MDALRMGSMAGVVGAATGLIAAPVGWVAGPILFLGGAAAVLVPRRFQAAPRRRRARKLLDRAGPTVRIAEAAPGLLRVRGRVKLLGKASFAAYERSARDRKCWRFVVHDGSDAAVVDDDCFEIWRSDLRRRGGTIEAGAEIDVVGRAHLRPAPDPELASGFRDSTVLHFEGAPDAPVLLLI